MIYFHMPVYNKTLCQFLEASGKFKMLRHALEERCIQDSAMIVYGGGADIQPALYGEKEGGVQYTNPVQDHKECEVYRRTRLTHYHLGICRGSQLLWALNGGRLWQDVKGHTGPHSIWIHNTKGGKIVGVPSTHHQCARVDDEFGKDRVLAYAYHPGAEAVPARSGAVRTGLYRVAEVHWHEKTRSLGIQGHPEYSTASKEFRNYVYHLLLKDERTKVA